VGQILRTNLIGGILRHLPIINRADVQVRIERRRQLARSAIRKSFRRPPRWLYPSGVEREYARFLVSYVDKIYQRVSSVLLPALPGLVQQANVMKPVTDSYDDNIHDLINALSIQIDQTLPPDWRATTLNIGQRVSSWNNAQWQKTLKLVMGVNTLNYEPWLMDDLKSFSRTNVELIKSIKDKSLTDIEVMAQSAVRSGLRHEVIAKQIQTQYGSTRARARLIARDQVSKLNGQLTEVRQKDLGISEYVWRTTGDGRVRSSHAIMDGKRCRWGDPTVYSDDGGKTWKKRTSIGGVLKHPGQDYQCRCWAEAVFDQIQAESDKIKNISRSTPEPEPELIKGIQPQTEYIDFSDMITGSGGLPSKASPKLKQAWKEIKDAESDLKLTATRDQISAVRNYSNQGDSLMNGFLRGNITEVSDDVQTDINLVNGLLEENRLKSDVVVYRGVDGWAAFDKLADGSVINEKGFLSTSLDKKQAIYFIDPSINSNMNNPILMKLYVPKGSPAGFIKQMSIHFTEYELLIHSGSKYRIIKRYPVTHKKLKFTLVEAVLEE
jgi:SPP1 gp7 family putative phage head morphogenesis protein